MPITTLDRAVLVALASLAKHWRDAILIAKPDTLLRWHRKGFSLFWRWKTRRRSKKTLSPLGSDTIPIGRAQFLFWARDVERRWQDVR